MSARESGGILIANRGEIAVRIASTARRMGYRTIAIYSHADRDAPHVRACDEAYDVGPAPASESYLDIDRVADVARASGAWAVHPGYGFLSERPDFAERCERDGLVFIGPSGAAMRALGDKARAKRALEPHGIPFVPGYFGEDQRDGTLIEAAHAIGFPVLVKAAAGGGGRGMRLLGAGDDIAAALASARAEAASAFGDATLLLERAIERPRHIEVQIAADAHGTIVHLGERDCSVQRRYQKLIEESPSPAVGDSLRERLTRTAIEIARITGYVGLGTIEFLLDERGEFYFIEANARLQVEHPVTEARYGLDLVRMQIEIARGDVLDARAYSPRGAAIEVRLCAEDARAGYVPQTGTVVAWRPPSGVRVDHALESGMRVTEYYDSMLAKIIAYGESREDARRVLARALHETVLLGLETNGAALHAILCDDAFARGETTTAFLTERADALARTLAAAASLELAIALAAALAYRRAAARSGFIGPWASWSANERPSAAISLADSDGARQVAFVAAVASSQATFNVTLAQRATAWTFEVEDLADDDAARTSDALTRVRVRVLAEDSRAATFRAAFTESDGTFYLAIGAATFAFTDLSRVPADARVPNESNGVLRAPTGGRVLAVRVAAGDRVAAKGVVVVLEAMKMEHAVALPVEGTIRELAVTAGARVDRGDLLARYDVAPAAQ